VTSREARALLERGFVVLERTHEDAALDALEAGITAIHRAHGAPTPFADRPVRLTPELEINPTGFVIFKLVGLRPELAPFLLSEPLLSVAREVLGPDCFVELTGASISDAARRFFTWHNHIGGIDVEAVRATRARPRFTRSERLIAVTYLDDIDPGGGELWAVPRRIDEGTEPLGDERSEGWPGAVPIRFPRGSTLVFEQCTWHSVRTRQRPGLRMFAGAYLTSTAAPPTSLVDDSLVGFPGGGELFRSVLPRPRIGR
jgi:hypothetical protein